MPRLPGEGRAGSEGRDGHHHSYRCCCRCKSSAKTDPELFPFHSPTRIALFELNEHRPLPKVSDWELGEGGGSGTRVSEGDREK